VAEGVASRSDAAFSFRDAAFRRLPFLLAIAFVALVADQVTKYYAVKTLTHSFGEQTDWQRFLSGAHPVPMASVPIIDGFWDHQYVENPGAAWGLLSRANESFRAPFFLVVSLIASALILNYYIRSPERFWMRRWALSLVFGGAVGNFVDRIRFGYVIDFIDWHYKEAYHWPTFNVADAAISIGVILLLIESFVVKEDAAA
jgi:signal peptidase II